MKRGVWKATSILLAAYAAAVAIGYWAGFEFTLFAVPALQIACTLFCIARIIQLRRSGGHKPDAPPSDRESYGFWLGGLVSSSTLLLALVVLSQAV
jgi:hypothetical protein